jgi:predicted CXXCH cytochrome family protein
MPWRELPISLLCIVILWPALASAQSAVAGASAGVTECLRCHTGTAEEMTKPVRHPGECLTCHINHKLQPGGTSPYLRTAQPELCLGCHDASSPQLVNAHQRQPFQTARCTACHSPHASRSANLVYDSQHGPFGGRHCDECHGEPVGGKVHVSGGKIKALCLNCHVKIGEQVAASRSAHAALVCTACHTPHASNFRPHLKESREALCRSCHTEPRTEFSH